MNNRSPSACRYVNDLVDELEQGIIEKTDSQRQNKINKIPLSSHLLLKFKDIETWPFIDTGSQITAISEIFYEKLKKNGKLLQMPVSNMIISTAIGKKSTCVKKQVLIEFESNGYKISHVSFVIPYLSSDIILGNDWNLKNNIIINHNSQTIKINNHELV